MPILNAVKKVGTWFAPPPATAADGRDQWPSRASFLLAAMGGCAGMGNLIRYPSQVYNNYGLQWFVPYLMTVFLIAIPVLTLEIAIGQAYRGGSVVAYNTMHHRLKGTGMGLIYVGFVVGPYFAVNLAWIMGYFRRSFISPLPWTGQASDYFMNNVVANTDPILPGQDGNDTGYVQFPGIGMIGETTGWMVFTWLLVWICIFKGVGLTGRVVYWTMGLPIVVTIILVGRSLSLDNAGEGVKYFWATWRGSELAKGQVWQTACGQVFFSTGVGFGYFTSYASYNRKHSNAVVDAIAIVSSNVAFENIAAFAVYGVVGFTKMFPGPDVPDVGGFSIGFQTLPTAIEQMPGANFWAVALFFTLMTLGFSSAFAMLDAVVTLTMDTGTKVSRPIVVTSLTLLSLALSLPYCTEFGYYLLDGVDAWTNNVALVFVVWSECVTSTTVYRWRDVEGQIGRVSFICYQIAFFAGQILGCAIGQGVSAWAGAVTGFAIYIAFTAAALLLAKKPDARAPWIFGSNTFMAKVFYLAFYSGEQLRRDLNVIVGTGKNWNIPVVWGPLVKYVSGPILAIVYSFSYPKFIVSDNALYGKANPLHILGFGVGHIVLLIFLGGFIVPRWFNVFIPPNRRNEGHVPYAPMVTQNPDDMHQSPESGQGEIDGEEISQQTSPDSQSLTTEPKRDSVDSPSHGPDLRQP